MSGYIIIIIIIIIVVVIINWLGWFFIPDALQPWNDVFCLSQFIIWL
jgi:hypothetical protein